MTLLDGDVGPAAQPRPTTAAVGVAEVSHATVRDQLSDYLDNVLPERDRARIDEHLASCRYCQNYRATLRATGKALASLPREKAPGPARERLLQIPNA